MKKLPFIILALFVISCSSPTEQERSYPYTEGAWLVHSPTYAEFIGEGNIKSTANTTQAQGDTVTIRNPNNEILKLRTDDGYTGGINLEFEDPTLLEDSIAITKTTLSFPNNNFYEFTGLIPRTGGTPPHMSYNFSMYYKCGTNFSAGNIYITTYRDTARTDIYRVYNFIASKSAMVIKEVANCSNP